MPRSAIAALLLLLALTGAGCTMWKEPKAQQAGPKNATAMEDLERLMWKSVQQGDWKDVRSHMAETFVLNAPEGRLDREAALARYQGLKLEEVSLGEVQTRANGADMVVSYTLTLHGTAAGQPIAPTPQRVLTVWQSVKRGWIQIAQSVQPAQP